MRTLHCLLIAASLLSAAGLRAAPKKSEPQELPVPTKEGSFSVGTTSRGALYGAYKIPRNATSIGILPDHYERNRGYTSAAMAKLLTQTALTFRREQQRRVILGDLSAKDGGKISGHKSHQNGLDADIALFYLDKSGKPIEAKELIKLDDTGTSKNKKYSLDADAMWRFVELLHQNKSAQIQYVFLAEPLCALVLEAGKKQGASDTLLEEIDVFLRQPTDSEPHDDHMHLRIYCPKDDGDLCTQTGPTWTFIK